MDQIIIILILILVFLMILSAFGLQTTIGIIGIILFSAIVLRGLF